MCSKVNFTEALLSSENVMKLSESILNFYRELTPPQRIPKGIVVLNPYHDSYIQEICNLFYQKYYGDTQPRTLMLGINPGRFGSGTTGISFTDPIRLEQACGISNSLQKKPELSSDFIYRMIDAYGGPTSFYKRYFISSVSPLGFTREGKNINYYDDKRLEKVIRPFAVACISETVNMGINRSRCYAIGEGKNFDFLVKLNDEHQWFEEIIPLAHPRFIMQYKRKQLAAYIQSYVDRLA